MPRLHRILICWLCWFGGVRMLPALGGDEAITPPSKNYSNQTAHYCGVQGLYRAFNSLGSEVPISELLKPKYIGKKGSSVNQLMQAARDYSFHAVCLERMTCEMLAEIDAPILLHVKSNVAARQYNHWVLYMGEMNGQAKIYDGPNPAVIKSYEDLAAEWDGLGIIVRPC